MIGRRSSIRYQRSATRSLLILQTRLLRVPPVPDRSGLLDLLSFRSRKRRVPGIRAVGKRRLEPPQGRARRGRSLGRQNFAFLRISILPDLSSIAMPVRTSLGG